jgi:branched-chain amino acid transport system substrate-binding protein
MRRCIVLAAAAAATFSISATAADSVKVGVVTFLSGPAAGAFGIPAKNAADAVVEALNAGGKVPGSYKTPGFGGSRIELTYIDEAGGTAKQVTEYRNLVQRQDVDLVIGYISSGDCLAIAPVAEELKKLTVLFDCGTPRIFEDASYKYVFRTGAHGGMDHLSVALYVNEKIPNLATYAGINQNYAWGQDSWNDFDAAMQAIKPGVTATSSQMPKFQAGQFGAEITALLNAKPDVIHSSFWGGDLEAFILQAVPRGLFQRSQVIITPGEHIMFRMANQIPDGTIIGARGTHGVFAPDTELNRWFRKLYMDKHNTQPIYATYKMTQAILAVKSAWEKAQKANGGKRPSQDQVIAAFEHLQWETPSGVVRLGLGKGHQAMQGTAVGRTKRVGDQMTVSDVRYFTADQVTPPDGVKAVDWIKSGGFLKKK